MAWRRVWGLSSRGMDGGEIASPDFVGMVLEEGAPILSPGSLSDLFDIFPDGSFVHHNR